MDCHYLANLLLPEITQVPQEIERKYPMRDLKDGAKVTRMAPSPTGFMHLGNLYSALVDERLAHQSSGVFYLRIEDTDRKRLVENGVDTIIKAFNMFGINFDEGATTQRDTGDYGPYHQSMRGYIYKVYIKELIRMGRAYPCFCTEAELELMHKAQETAKENFGYYGKYANYRDCNIEIIEAKLKEGAPYVIRFKSMGSIENKIKHIDLVKGEMELTQNNQDIVILKSDELPTYHFAHVIDDHLMGTTHVVRGEEWLATLPIHIELFDTLGFKRPEYVHTAQLMKTENGNKRKLSKRKDPELALNFYYQQGFPVPAVIEYLLTLLNSNFEEWRIRNPDLSIDAFEFSTQKMPTSGSLFDMDKLNDVSKNLLSRMSCDEIYQLAAKWLKENDKEFYDLFSNDPDYTKSILNIGRGGKKPRKDIARYNEIKPYMSFFFDHLFTGGYEDLDPNISSEDAVEILKGYRNVYEESDDNQNWFDKIKILSQSLGYTCDMKEYRESPGNFKGNVSQVSTVIRIALTGRRNSPDLYEITKILGKDRVLFRIERMIEKLN